MAKLSDDPNELARRHRTAMLVVVGFLLLTVALLVVAFLAAKTLQRPGDSASMIMGLRVAILVGGVGVFVLRRTRFSPTRLRDIVAVKGQSTLLKTLQDTTIVCASIGGAIALMGFIVTIRTGDWIDMLRAAGVAVVVLLYCYPFRGAWQRAVIQFSRES